MTQERLIELQKKLLDIEKRLKPLEWDASRDQINEFKKVQMEKLKVEHKSLLEEINQLKSGLTQEL